DRRGGGRQVLQEVLGGAGGVRTVDGGDRGVGQFDALVQRGDRRVVPGGDVALEHGGEGVGVHVQFLDALEVEDDGDGGDVHGEVDRLVNALREGVLLDLLELEGAVGAGVVGAATDEGLAARAGALGRVVDGHAGVGGL